MDVAAIVDVVDEVVDLINVKTSTMDDCRRPGNITSHHREKMVKENDSEIDFDGRRKSLRKKR